ncbi:L-tyrosine/L-tryptophan isonitrile synthase family protein [Kribbella sp. NPDC006257]|uniref:L-tyrosine/L-tryptophan isonitrile synthase family protein n=1 Tax=Kribbella sp. NPDC006257 TaxID=3156738 RepID=UPI0033B8037E
MTTVLARHTTAPVRQASSLAHVGLADLEELPVLRTASFSSSTKAALFDGLLRSAEDAADRLAAKAPRDPEAALIHLLTRNRFLKGSRSNAPATDRHITQAIAAGEPIPLALRGFPFKQCDNGLKASGPLPDLAEAGALIRLAELAGAYRQLYSPGVHITLLADGGYYRPRPASDLSIYRQALEDLITGLHLQNTVTIVDQAAALKTASPERWSQRASLIERLHRQIAQTIRYCDAASATNRLNSLAAVPFDALFRSMIYSVPVPGGSDPAWTTAVLSDIYTTTGPLGEARREVLRRAWQDTTQYTAVATADHQLQLFDTLPYLRLASGAPRPGAFGFSYLGGSLLPWHGTGFIDERHRVGVDFAVTLRAAGYVALGTDQPFAYVAPSLVEETLRTDLIRLKSR